MKKSLNLLFCLVFCCFFMTGCVDSNTILTINKDRSANVEVKALVEKSSFAMAKKQIDEVKKSYEKGGSKITNIENGSKIGISAKTYSQNMDKYLISGLPAAFVPTDGNYITIKKGVFRDKYSIDAIVDFTDKKSKNNSYMDFISDSFFNDGKFNFTLNLPIKADDSNAGKVTNEGKTLEWTLFYGDKNEIHAKFTLINWVNIIWTSVAGILLITLSILGIIYRKPIAEKFNNINFKSVFKKIFLATAVIVALGLIGFGLYSGYNYYQNKMRNVALYPIYENGKWGYINEAGEVIVQPQYDYAEPFKDGVAIVFKMRTGLPKKDSEDIKSEISAIYGIIKSQNMWGGIVHPKDDRYSTELYWLAYNWQPYGDFNFIDNKGNNVDGISKYKLIPKEFNNVKWFHTVDNAKYGFVDKQGGTVIYPLFDEVQMFSEGYAAIRVGQKWGYIDEKGKYLVTPKFDEAYRFTNGLARYKIKEKYGFVNKKGLDATTQKFDYALPFSENLASVRIKKKAGFIDKSGHWILETNHFSESGFSEGLASLFESSNDGYINKKGNFVIKPEFGEAYSFSNGTAIVEVVGKGIKQGVIDKNGKFIIQPKYADITKVSNLYKVQKNIDDWNDYYYINNKGQEVYHYKYPAQ